MSPRRALVLASLLAFACSASPDRASDAGSDAALRLIEGGVPFVAMPSDFTGFHSWTSFYLTSDLAPGDSHINGPRHIFINHVPPKGSTAFPVGTIIVKETDPPGPRTGRTVFASVKRGGNFDPTGDVDWEWFSLQNLPDGAESILWRGPGPLSGSVYGNGQLGGCNACHGVAKGTDYVLTPQLEAMITPPKG